MKANKTFYICPEIEIYDGLSISVLAGSDKSKSGYAIDNKDADDDKIIPVVEQTDNLWVDID